MREYDRVDEITISRRVQLRRGISTERGAVVKFVLQLEYRHEDSWNEVVRFDHDPASEGAHDVTAEGLHMDIYRDGEKVDVEHVAGPMPADAALDTAEDHLAEQAERYIKRFEQWHDLNRNRNRDR